MAFYSITQGSNLGYLAQFLNFGHFIGLSDPELSRRSDVAGESPSEY
jgi:hypothetical protein